eukprot:6669765-Prymnesium_polylepis.1
MPRGRASAPRSAHKVVRRRLRRQRGAPGREGVTRAGRFRGRCVKPRPALRRRGGASAARNGAPGGGAERRAEAQAASHLEGSATQERACGLLSHDFALVLFSFGRKSP